MKLEHSFTVPAELDTVWEAVLDPERVAPCMPGATLAEVDGDSFKGSVKVKMGPISLLYKGTGEFLSKDEPSRTVVIKASGKDSRGNGTASATVTVALTASGTSTTGSVVTDLSITGKPAQFGRGLISEVGGKILDSFATCLASKLAPAKEEKEEPPKLSLVENPTPTESAVAESAVAAAAGELVAAGESAAGESASAGRSAAGESATAGKSAAAESAAAGERAVSAERAEAMKTGKAAGEAAAEHAPAPGKPKLAAAPEPENEPIDLLSYAGPSVLKRAAPLMALVAALVAFIALRRRRR